MKIAIVKYKMYVAQDQFAVAGVARLRGGTSSVHGSVGVTGVVDVGVRLCWHVDSDTLCYVHDLHL